MELIPVLDLRGGVAVRADGGVRDRYLPVGSTLAPGSEPLELTRAFRERLGLARLYLADLDAIASGGRAVEATLSLLDRLVARGSRPWVDAGASKIRPLERLLEAGAERVVIGLETLPALEGLEGLARELGDDRLAFSLDLREGRPVTAWARGGPRGRAIHSPEAIAAAVLAAGISTVIVLDLARVGRRAGPPLRVLRRLAGRMSEGRWYAGGGIRNAADLADLAGAGCRGCLVGTALHEGTIGRREIEALPTPPALPGRTPTGLPTPEPRSRRRSPPRLPSPRAPA